MTGKSVCVRAFGRSETSWGGRAQGRSPSPRFLLA